MKKSMDITDMAMKTNDFMKKVSDAFWVYSFMSMVCFIIASLAGYLNDVAIGYDSTVGFHHTGSLFAAFLFVNYVAVCLVIWMYVLWQAVKFCSLCAHTVKKILKNAKDDKGSE